MVPSMQQGTRGCAARATVRVSRDRLETHFGRPRLLKLDNYGVPNIPSDHRLSCVRRGSVFRFAGEVGIGLIHTKLRRHIGQGPVLR